MKNELLDDLNVKGTIQKTLMTALLFEGFWDRWIAHGVKRQAADAFRSQIKTVEHWTQTLKKRTEDYEKLAYSFQKLYLTSEAEKFYQSASLHANLIQWLFPVTCDEKRTWFTFSKNYIKRADGVSKDKIKDAVIEMDGIHCFGRIRIPERPKGCIIMVNPIDSSKEELFTYEQDFSSLGFVTVSFDGPGQGETLVFNGFKATEQRWNRFVNKVIDFAASKFPDLNIHLFGTSSGAAWAIHGSNHPKVSKVVAVSPACENDVKLPDYFLERMSYVLENNENTILPNLEDFESTKPIFLFHGNKDVMVRDEDIYHLYDKLSRGKQLVEYQDEGHCCNYKLHEIRQISAQWFLED